MAVPRFLNARQWCSLAFALLTFWLLTFGLKAPNECDMTYMHGPRLVQVPLVSNVRTQYKYALLRYLQIGVQTDYRKPQGSPILFLPGHLGSAMQARSLGSHAVQLQQEAMRKSTESQYLHSELDVYTVDFNEEWTGLSGHNVMDQASFINAAVKSILELYKNPSPKNEQNSASWQQPSHVVVVAHSMAGIAVRTAVTLGNHKAGSIRTIITLSTPHQHAPFRLDSTMESVYARTNGVWREAAHFRTNRHGSHNEKPGHTELSPRPSYPDAPSSAVLYRYPTALLRKVAAINVVSIAGGHQDHLILSKLTRLDGLVQLREQGLQFLATDLKNGVSADHLAILWCAQLTQQITKGIRALSAKQRSSGWEPASSHIHILNESLLSEGMRGQPILAQDEETVFFHEYASPLRPALARWSYWLHHFIMEYGSNVLIFWLAIFTFILREYVQTSSEISVRGSRRGLSLAVWPDYHHPVFSFLLHENKESSHATKKNRKRARITVAILVVVLSMARFIAPFLPTELIPLWLWSMSSTIEIMWKTMITFLFNYTMTAAFVTVVLLLLDNMIQILLQIRKSVIIIIPNFLLRHIMCFGKYLSRHLCKFLLIAGVTIFLFTHTLVGRASRFVSTPHSTQSFFDSERLSLRWPSVASSVASLHVSMIFTLAVSFLSLLFSLVGAHPSRNTEYRRLVLWGYMSVIPVIVVNSLASFEVVMWLPASQMDSYSWGAFHHVLTCLPITTHLLLARYHPLKAPNFSEDSDEQADKQEAIEDAEAQMIKEEEEQTSKSKRKRPDYRSRLAKRSMQAGCEAGPHEFGAPWSEFTECLEAPNVTSYRFANGEEVIEGPSFRVINCNCAVHGLDPTDWCSFCRCKKCGYNAWADYNGSGPGHHFDINTDDGHRLDYMSGSQNLAKVALCVTAFSTLMFAFGAVYRLHIFAAILALQILVAHMQSSPLLRRKYQEY